ncbi:MAG: acylphosphatase [Candidatus Aenigmarchaeota archaeon ex4484_224]|nr:MAG: acylphosphatase [Candidatus Aenigmarchaeota archaeon ex4484_224]
MRSCKRIKVKIYGRVQGVGFRYSVYLLAKSLGIKGWVRNCEDGTVEAIFEGYLSKVEEMIKFCKKGPPLAKVERIEIKEENCKNEFENFEIRF